MSLSGKVVISIASLMMVVLFCGTWVIDRNECTSRGDALEAWAEGLKRDLARRLPPGTARVDALEFFSSIGVSAYTDKSSNRVTGTIHTVGCSPGWYCGDSALIGLTVKLDESDRVASTDVMTMMTNCL